MDLLKNSIFGVFQKYYFNFFSIIKFLFPFLIFINSNCFLFGHINELRFSYINTNNGLSNNNITCIVQDKMGFIWIGTMDGLNRYDGYNIKTFKKVLYDTNTLSDNMIYDIYIDCQQQLWVGTNRGLCKYNPDYENFTSYIFDKKRIDIGVSNRVTSIAEDSKHNLYFAAEIGTIYYYDRKNNSFVPDTHNFKSIKKFKIDNEDNFWIGGINGLIFYDKTNNITREYKTYSKNKQKYPISDVNTLNIEGDTIWIGTLQGRIYYFLKETMELNLLRYNFENTYYIVDIFRRNDGYFYISTTNALFVYDKMNETCVAYRYERDNPTGINSGGVTKVYEDRQGNLWVGTAQGGVNLAVSGKAFRNFNTFSKGLKLDFNNVNCILEDSNGKLWLGSYDQGVSFLDRKTGKSELFLHNPKNPKSLSFGTVNTIFEDKAKNIWIGTYLGKLQKYNARTKEFISYSFPFDKLNPRCGFDVRSIIEDENGIIWFLSHGSGLIKFNPKTGESKNFRMDTKNIANSLADDWSFQLIQDKTKIIWIASPSGLSRFDPVTGGFNNYYHNDNDTSSLCNNFINVVFEDSYNNLWLGTAFGLDMFDRTRNRFVHFYENDGLPSNQIKSIIEYKPGQLWIGTSYGLSRMEYVYNKKTGEIKSTFRNFDKSDNIQDFIFWDRSVCKTKDNQIIFGGENGIVAFQPGEITDNIVPPEVYITNFKINNKKIEIGEYGSIIKQSIIYTKEIKLKYDQNFITFEFIALNFISREKNSYKYKLEGLDADWIDAGNKREATYTNIDPGEYYFRVIAANNDGYWNNEGVTLKLIIAPPFWMTWWFRIIVSVFIISLIIGYYFDRINNYREQNILLERKVEERTSELREVNKELVNKNTWISAQNKEIVEQNLDIFNKSEEILVQKELLEEQKTTVEQAYEELIQYRTKLEELVDERTRELIAAKEKAEESDRLKSSFLANMSHEIRTPLNSIIGFSNLIVEEKLTDEESGSYKKIIGNSCNSLLKLINDVIDFSKIEAGHIEIFFEDVPIKSILDEIKEIYNLEISNLPVNDEEEKHLEFKVKIEKNLNNIVLSTDQYRLKQVLSILINNAIKFTNNGSIEVGCKLNKENNIVEFFVRDTGIGIRTEDQLIIFQRFRKAEDDKSIQYRGAGLGLSIAQHLVSLLGGNIYVESEIEKGTVFYFTIPVKSQQKFDKVNQKSTIEDFSIPDLTGKVVLVAEDDFSNYAYLLKLLQKTNSKILHANNGIEVLNLLRENTNISLILMDIKMPLMNGFEAFTELRKINDKVPVIAQTAYAFTTDMQKIKELGFNDYISKPINSVQLYYMISEHIS